MERLTERHAGVAVIKDKSKQKDAMEALARYEETGLTPEEIMDGKMLTGWIPVKERLPIGGTYVLCCFDSGEVDVLWQNWEEDEALLNYAGIDGEITKVTAWMPLPEPYTEQTKG